MLNKILAFFHFIDRNDTTTVELVRLLQEIDNSVIVYSTIISEMKPNNALFEDSEAIFTQAKLYKQTYNKIIGLIEEKKTTLLKYRAELVLRAKAKNLL